MGLYLLNISVDTTDPNPAGTPEDLSINDQESIIEIVVEKVLGYENAIKEYDDNDTDDHTKKINIKIDLIASLIDNIPLNFPQTETTTKTFAYYDIYLTNGFKKLITPPPQA